MTSRLRAPLAAALFALSLALAAQSRPTYTVSSAKELLQRLGPNRIIVLKKGDYSLPSVYAMKGAGFEWLEGEDGKELMVQHADNLTLRGQDGARIVTDSLKSYLIGFYDSSKVEVQNLAFARVVKGDAAPEAGLFYAESVGDLSLSGLDIAGPAGFPLELWNCDSVTLKDVRVSGGLDGAISIGKVGTFSASGGAVTHNTGYPLVYIEETGSTSFDGTDFSDNTGGNFLENWPGEGDAGSVAFSSCSFSQDEFDYFVGNSNLPETTDCSFKGSSFDESWADNSVDTSADESYGAYDASTETHYDDVSGLSFDYPAGWDYEAGPVEGQAVVYGPDDDSVIFFAKALDVSKPLDRAKEAPKLAVQALAAFTGLVASQASIKLDVTESAALSDWEDWQMAEYSGSASTPDGAVAQVRLRLVVMDDGVWALLVLSTDETKLADDGELGAALLSLTGGGGSD